MAGSDALFAGSIPEIYDRLMVPLLFEPYALDLAERIAQAGSRDVLEVAAGTGVLTRMLAARMPEGTRIVATDLNQPMLDHAAARQAGHPHIAWRQADASALPFPEAAFDAVACQFGAMFFPDRIQAYREARRVLRPGGRFLLSVWDRLSENEVSDVVVRALAPLLADDTPPFIARTPHGYHDPERIGAELRAAGFDAVSIDHVSFVSRASTAMDAATAICQGTPQRNEIEARGIVDLATATGKAADALERRFGKGPIEGRIAALVITAA